MTGPASGYIPIEGLRLVRQVRIDGAGDMRDVTVVHVPQQCMAAVTGARGAALRSIEEETGAFCFIARDYRKEEQLFIFG